MSKALYIIGNGFDKAHGLKTSYWDFRTYLESTHWEFLQAFEKLYGFEPLDDLDPYVPEGAKLRWEKMLQGELWSRLEDNMGHPNIAQMENFSDCIVDDLDLDSGNVGIRDTLDEYWRREYDDGKKLQKEREELERSIETAKKHRAQTCREMFQAFNAGSSSFFSKSLIYRAMQVLQDETIPSADIPYMHVKTIEYLLRQKKCICGTHLDEGTVPYENVKALMDYLPPQSISTTVSQFKKDAKTRISALNRTNIPDAVSASYTFISDDDDTITDKEDELRRLESKMASSDDITVAVRKLETEIQQCKKSISTQTSTIARLTSEQDSLISTRDRAEKDRRELSLKDDKNRLIEVCRLYAGEIYNQLTSTYQASEKEVRDKLQATINSIL